MNELIVQILPLINQVVNHATKDRDEIHELTQELILKCYDNEKKVKEMHASHRLLGWLYIVCRNRKVDFTHEVKRHNKLKARLTPIETNHVAPNIKRLDEMMLQLNPIESMWVSTYLYHNLNVNAMSEATNVCRAKINKELNKIFERWKQSDIYLQD